MWHHRGSSFTKFCTKTRYNSPFSSVVEHWSRKPGVVSSNLTGGNPTVLPMIQLEVKHYSMQSGNHVAPTRCWCSGIMQDSHSCDPGSIPGQRKVLTYRPALPSSKVFPTFPQRTRGSLAEWSKALVLGTSPKGRGFESLSCQNDNFASIKKVVLLQVRLELTTPACLKYCL